MIQFNKLSINQAGTILTIDASVKDESYYTNVYIDNVAIDTQDTFLETGPSTNKIYLNTLSGNNKSIQLSLTYSDLLQALDSNMFFVWITTKGTPSSDTPCGEDVISTVGVAIDLYPLYQYAINYMNELTNNCNIPKGFINFILRLKALKLAIQTGNYTKSINFWNMFFKNIDLDTTNTSNCSCHG